MAFLTIERFFLKDELNSVYPGLYQMGSRVTISSLTLAIILRQEIIT